jgi:Ion transport protein
MKDQIVSLIKSLGQLVNVLLFLLFLFLIFGILGNQLFEGQFYQRCRMTDKPDKYGNWPVDPDIQRLCSKNDSSGWFKCPAGRYCGAPRDYNLSLANENFTLSSYNNFGLTTFDNIAVAMLTIF